MLSISRAMWPRSLSSSFQPCMSKNIRVATILCCSGASDTSSSSRAMEVEASRFITRACSATALWK